MLDINSIRNFFRRGNSYQLFGFTDEVSPNANLLLQMTTVNEKSTENDNIRFFSLLPLYTNAGDKIDDVFFDLRPHMNYKVWITYQKILPNLARLSKLRDDNNIKYVSTLPPEIVDRVAQYAVKAGEVSIAERCQLK
jgi:hypothetical protein